LLIYFSSFLFLSFFFPFSDPVLDAKRRAEATAAGKTLASMDEKTNS
jgi:hypothetical protein